MHIKRLAAPKTWVIHRKEHKWTTRQTPGPHSLSNSIPLNDVIKTFLGLASTTREVKKILNSGKILIDGKVRKDHKFPVGIMDVIDIPDLKKTYLLILNKRGSFSLKQYKNSNEKIAKIINKTYLKNGKLKLNIYDGKNFIVTEKDYNVNDSVVLNLKENKISKHVKLEKGALIYYGR